jgi:DNA-binding IclR family transcriptional regulator
VNVKMGQQKDDQKGKSSYKPIVPAVEQASRILLCLGESPNFKMTLTDICRQVGIFKSKGFSILNTLSQFGLVDKDPETKTYYLGTNLIFLSRHVLDNMEYPEMVTPFLDSLSKNTSGAAVFGLIQGSDVFIVAKRERNQGIGFTLGLGARFHITSGAPGKAIAAWMSKMEREKLLAKKKLYFYGDPSRMDMKRLGEEIDQCRVVGFVQDLGEVTPGVNIVSAPVFGLHRKVIGCIVLVGTFAVSMIAEFGPRVASIARQVSHKLGAPMKNVKEIELQ